MLSRHDKPPLTLGVPKEEEGNSIDNHPVAPEPPLDVATLIARLEYQQRILAENSGRLDMVQEALKTLEQRLTQLEVFTHNLRQQQDIGREMAERQTRYSALDLASRTAGSPDSGIIISLYETFLAVLKGVVH